ncbi:MAG: hypothetical protein RIC06_02000 [Cyclobacteriaceae bacterium]
MGQVIKISGKEKPTAISKALEKIQKAKKNKKSISEFYGALPLAFEDGLTYQQKLRNEWE